MTVALLLSLVAAAASAPPPEGVRPDEKAAYGVLLRKEALAADAEFNGACADAKTEHVSTLPWKLADQPATPVWREKVRVTGCGRTAIENINVARLGGASTWRLVHGLPGDTLLVDLQPQRVALNAALEAAQPGLPAGCSGFALADIYIGARPGKLTFLKPGEGSDGRHGVVVSLPPDLEAHRADYDLARAWAEVWPMKVCGKDRTTMVVLLPGAGKAGGRYILMPIWQQIEAHGEGARPKPAPEP